ncbi:hypothetical protein DPMN_095469 [Dreissena polymorpha]|uniref:Uncharacterized protein n=1 Tax=Dreissena polymorpha TaxID=45954 RepID=A0A9D4L814_DREPO|nr:hypothetical protein DPMN_095469 [Dreissena polymorpha]
MAENLPYCTQTWQHTYPTVHRHGSISTLLYTDMAAYLPYCAHTWQHIYPSVHRHGSISTLLYTDMAAYLPYCSNFNPYPVTIMQVALSTGFQCHGRL